jgi:hypothetical protein
LCVFSVAAADDEEPCATERSVSFATFCSAAFFVMKANFLLTVKLLNAVNSSSVQSKLDRVCA